MDICIHRSQSIVIVSQLTVVTTVTNIMLCTITIFITSKVSVYIYQTVWHMKIQLSHGVYGYI